MRKFLSLITLCGALLIPICVNASEPLNCKKLEGIFNTKTESKQGVCKVDITRTLNVTHMGKKLSPEMMELAFTVNFEKVDEQTVVMGEFALLEEEVAPVIDELRKGNVEVSAIHNHMIGEKPRIVFIHFQGMGDIDKLAKIVKSAINKTSNQ